jgi:cold shock CspA family protein
MRWSAQGGNLKVADKKQKGAIKFFKGFGYIVLDGVEPGKEDIRLHKIPVEHMLKGLRVEFDVVPGTNRKKEPVDFVENLRPLLTKKSERVTGTFKWFSVELGYGFIIRDDAKPGSRDQYAPSGAVYKMLKGMRVEFKLVPAVSKKTGEPTTHVEDLKPIK